MENTSSVASTDAATTPTPVVEKETLRWHKGPFAFILLISIVLVGALVSVYIKHNVQSVEAAEAYTLVPEKISASAAISVKLPEDISFNAFNPATAVHFTPEIKGTWQSDAKLQKDGVYKFLPETKLAVGAYYLASLNAPEIKIEKMFTVESDPTVLAVFPKKEAEVGEYTNITIMFSRPMVPLGTLSKMADVTPPVSISPSVEGRWKWITTRTLQFIPTTHLKRSSHYRVEVQSGFTSVDGVATPPFVHEFTTRTLKYQSQGYFSDALNTATIAHSEPIRIYFNQPFDLTRTLPSLSLKTASGTNVAFVAAYGTRDVTNEKTKKLETLSDHAVLEVYPANDSHGRKFLWDFNTTYTLTLAGAVPSEGDVLLTEGTLRNFHTEEIITDVTAVSPRSNAVSPAVFDPTGTLVFHISELIDLPHSTISGKGINTITYGEKCREPAPGEEVVQSSDCEKVPDQHVLIVSFNANTFTQNETSSVIFTKLQNTDGITLNTEPITRTFTTYKKLELISVSPADDAKKASLTEMTLCTSVPLSEPSEEDFYKKIHSNMMIGKWNWEPSYYVGAGFTQKCPVGTFITTVRYGLVPNYAYQMTLLLDDHFGQHLESKLAFTTEDADPLAKGFNHLQSQVLMTPPERTKLSYGLDFLNAIDMTICKVSAETMLSYHVFPPDIEDSAETLKCIDKTSKHISLPDSYATRKYFQVDLKDYYTDTIGNYVVVFSHPEYRKVTSRWSNNKYTYTLGAQLYEKTYITVTNLAVGAKEVERTDRNMGYGRGSDDTDTANATFMKERWPTNLYWVNDVHSLTPLADVVVTPYAENEKSLVTLASKNTNSEGIIETPSADNIAGAVIRNGNDSAVISSHSDTLNYANGVAEATRRDYIYTDRPIYRPGDTVHIKGVSRIGFDAKYEVDSGSTTIEVRDAAYESAAKNPVHMSANGTYETTFTIDTKAPLGYYQIASGRGGYGSFQVEEYVAPQFKVVITPDKEEYTSGETATLNIDANYYFGVPVDRGDVEYRLVSQDYYFDRYTDEYFNFGAGWYGDESGWYGDRYLLSGKTKLGKDGKASLAQLLDIDKLWSGNYRNQSKLVTLYVTIKNENGQSVSSQRSFILHRGSYYAGLSMDNYFFVKGQQGVVKIKTVDIKGVPVKESNLTLSLERIEWKSYKRQEVDGNFYYRTEQVKTHIRDAVVDTDKNGDGSYTYTADDAGEYLFTLKGVDENNNPITATYQIYVSGEGAVTIRPTNNASLELVTQKTDLLVGETGHFVIKSPYQKAKALITLSRGKIFEHKVIDINSALTEFNFTVTPDEAPNVVAEVLLLSPSPEVKYGNIYYSVGTKEKELTVAITPNKKAYLPGEAVTLNIVVSNMNGAPAQSELSLAVVDMSVLALTGNQKKNPVSFFYDNQPLTIRTSANVKNILTVAEIPTGTKGGSGGGGDDLEKKKRGVFRDTAFWTGTVQTDSHGVASVTFTLPDNLTEWQAESVAVTKDTHVGAGYSTFTTRKTIMAVPLKPRFILPGDTFSIGGTVFNESDSAQTLDVSVTSPTLALTGSTHMSLTVAPHTSVSASFPVRAPEQKIEGAHQFTFTAKNTEHEDVVDGSIPVERNETYESTVTSGRITDASWKEELYLPKNIVADRGGLSITLSGTMATVLDDAIRGMLIYPYECSEQTASKLRTIALVKENTNLFGTSTLLVPEHITLGNYTYTPQEIVTMGLAKLYQNQDASGGVSYYKNSPVDPYLTIETLGSYIDLMHAGYSVDQSKMNAAASYIFNRLNYPGTEKIGNEEIIQGAYVLSRMNDSRLLSADTLERLRGFAKNTDTIHRGLSTPALAYLTILAEKEKFGFLTTSRLYAEIENRSVIDARGTTLGSNNDMPSASFENSIINTALALKAFSETKHDSPLLEGYIRALKQSRSHDGSWASTYNSITVIDGMTAFLSWKNEADAHMKIAVSLGNSPVLTNEFSKANLLTTVATTVPMAALAKGVSEKIVFTKENLGNNNDAYYYDALLKYYLPANTIAPRDEGFSVERALYRLDDTNFATPVTSAVQGEVLHARAIIHTPSVRQHVSVEDFIPAGVEIINQHFATEDQTLGIQDGGGALGQNTTPRSTSWLRSELAQIFSSGNNAKGPNTDTKGIVSDETYAGIDTTITRLYPTATEVHDDRIFAYVDELSEGEYVYDYYIRALVPGTYQYLPMIVSELYTPEHFGRTAGSSFTVTEKPK